VSIVEILGGRMDELSSWASFQVWFLMNVWLKPFQLAVIYANPTMLRADLWKRRKYIFLTTF